MSKNIFFSRLSLLVEMFRNGASLTFDDVLSRLERRSSQDEDFTISLRTFQRDLKEIASLFGIEIVCNRATNEYFIKENFNEDGKIRLLESIEITSLIKSANDTAGIVFLEKRKSKGTEHFSEILHAIKNDLCLHISYSGFLNNQGVFSERKVYPIAIKESKNRWYLIAQDAKDEVVKSFGLDRILNLIINKDERFSRISFDVIQAYQNVFGILKGTESVAEIKISCTERQYRYLETLPLHESQRLFKKEKDRFVIALDLIPTYDFTMEILAMGKEVKVLEPKQLVADIKRKIQENLDQYNS